MKCLIKVAFCLALCVSIMPNAQATIIKLNDTIELGVLSLDESFFDFYNYNPTKKDYSSHTGYEVDNSFVMFFAEYESNLALFALAGNPITNVNGKASFRIKELSKFGNVIFQDDSGDKSVTNGVDWKWANKKNDGLIFQLNDANNFNLDLKVSNTKGLDSGYKFLSFENDKVKTHDVKSKFNVATIPEPSTLAILGLALVGLTVRRRNS